MHRILGPILSLALFLLVFEIGLRVAPALIPLDLLKRFQRELRIPIAQRLSLWNETQMRPIDRDDGGPMLQVFEPHSRVHYDFGSEDESGTMALDAIGFCNPERDDPERPKIDLIAIGDSFTWCLILAPEATWSSEIGRITGIPVLNLGRGGVGPYEYLQILRNVGLEKQPEVVVMQIYAGNDLRDSHRYHQHVEAAREGRVLYSDASDRSRNALDYDRVLDGPIGRNSYAVNALLIAAAEGSAALVRWLTGDVRADENFRYTFELGERSIAMNVQNADESEVRHARLLQAGEIDLAVFDGALERFASLGRTHGFTPVVTWAPSAHTAYAEFVTFADDTLTDLMPWFSSQQREYIRRRCEELGLEFLDLTPTLQAAAAALGPDRLLYHPINIHWTAEGNRVVAETVAPLVERLHRARQSLTSGLPPR